MTDTGKTMRELCEDEPLLEGFLQSKGLPFTLANPIVDMVTFDDVCQVLRRDRGEFLAEFEGYKREREAVPAAAGQAVAR